MVVGSRRSEVRRKPAVGGRRSEIRGQVRKSSMRQAQFYTKEEKAVLCLLCPRRCRLAEGQTGICGARRVVEGLHT